MNNEVQKPPAESVKKLPQRSGLGGAKYKEKAKSGENPKIPVNSHLKPQSEESKVNKPTIASRYNQKNKDPISARIVGQEKQKLPLKPKHSSSPHSKDKTGEEFGVQAVPRRSQQVSKYQINPEPKKNAPYARLKTADPNVGGSKRGSKVEIIKNEDKRK